MAPLGGVVNFFNLPPSSRFKAMTSGEFLIIRIHGAHPPAARIDAMKRRKKSAAYFLSITSMFCLATSTCL
jgi:hypothetical protein